MKEFIKWSSILNLNISSCLDKRLAKFGINSSQFFYILWICDNPGITRESIMDTVYRNPSNVTRALVQLEECGYIKREQSKEDKRTCSLYPTEKALQDYKEISNIITTIVEEVLEPFSEEEKQVLPILLKKAGLNAVEMNRKERDKERQEEE